MSDSLQPYGLKPTRLLCPWDSPGKNTEVGCHALLQRIFLTQGWELTTVTSPVLASRRHKRLAFDRRVRKIPLKEFLLGESHRQRSLAGYSSKCHKESGTIEVTCHACTWINDRIYDRHQFSSYSQFCFIVKTFFGSMCMCVCSTGSVMSYSLCPYGL